MNELEMTNDFEYENSDVTEGAVDLQEDNESREDDSDDGQEGFVDLQNPDEEDEEDIGEDEEDDDSSDPEGAVQEPPRQTREENAAIRAARLRAEREGYEKAESNFGEEIAKSGILNPYTGKPFSSLKDFRDYSEKVKRARLEERAKKEGKDVSIVEEEELNREFISNMRKEREAKNNKDNFIANDLQDFIKSHPEFATPEKLIALENNKTFRNFCGKRFGTEPLSELYDSYVDFMNSVSDSNNTEKKAASRSARSTSTGADGGDMLTPAERKSLNEWNEAFPEMKMTPKEFKSRR